ncbi:MAG: pro-sigmaK processing inhibitor BofA family protein [Oscillospiraceae bacterium]|nr:pro-sigmaK processing inhibitor BofA family protein [Oscillospiraceae bacterium]
MDIIIGAGAAVIGIILLIVTVRIFASPIKLVLKLGINTLLGFVSLIAADIFGAYIGLGIGVNFINAAVIGILGLPGFALLFLIKWLCAF